MYYSQLSMLKHIITTDEMKKFDNYLNGLSEENNQRITASKVYAGTGINIDLCRKILNECAKIGLLSQKFIVICPECGGMIKETNNLEQVSDMSYCYMCGKENLEISSENIVIAYALEEEKIPFNKGQQKSIGAINEREKSFVAQQDNLKSFLESGIKNEKIEERAIKAGLVDDEFVKGKKEVINGVEEKIENNKRKRTNTYLITVAIYISILIVMGILCYKSERITMTVVSVVVTAMGFIISVFVINIINQRFPIDEEKMIKIEMEKYNLEIESKRIDRIAKYTRLNRGVT